MRRQILIDASNGASDYGNKFGEPLVAGYTRTFGQRMPNGERRVRPAGARRAHGGGGVAWCLRRASPAGSHAASAH